MKHYSIIFSFLVVWLSSCSTSINDQLLGEWLLEDIKYENLDQLCQNEVKYTLQSIENQLVMIDAELESPNPKNDKSILLSKRQELEEQKTSITVDNYKKEYNDIAESVIDKFTYQFEKDGKFVASLDRDTKKGTWNYRNDSIFTTIEGQDADVLLVKDISSSQLVIDVETPNQAPLHRILTFKKK